MRICDIISRLEEIAPPSLAEKWDNPGFLLGDDSKNACRVFFCLEINSSVLKQAQDFKADLIITHHPLIFKPLSKIIESDPTGRLVTALIKNDISVFSMHTNFDKADGGMNDLLAEALGLEEVRHYTEEECKDTFGNPLENIGRVGKLEPPMSLEDFSDFVRATLGCKNLRTVGNCNEEISVVALCSGSGGDLLHCALHAGADVYLTADIGHHDAQTAAELGLNIIDAGHFETENIICDFLKKYFEDNFPEIETKTADAESYFN